jgi:hypothetical protein
VFLKLEEFSSLDNTASRNWFHWIRRTRRRRLNLARK